MGEPTAPHVREWQVRVSIFESGDDTSANVVLVTEAPTRDRVGRACCVNGCTSTWTEWK